MMSSAQLYTGTIICTGTFFNVAMPLFTLDSVPKYKGMNCAGHIEIAPNFQPLNYLALARCNLLCIHGS